MIRRGILLFLIVLIPVGGLSAGHPWSYSIGISGQETVWQPEESLITLQQQALGVDLRGSALLERGFYYGNFFNLSMPLLLVTDDPMSDELETGEASHDLVFTAGIPFGYRFRIREGRTGLYIGAGPAFHALVDMDREAWLAGGVAVEAGTETLRERGVGLSTGFRAVLPIGALSVTGIDEVEAADIPVGFTFHIGLSWTGERD